MRPADSARTGMRVEVTSMGSKFAKLFKGFYQARIEALAAGEYDILCHIHYAVRCPSEPTRSRLRTRRLLELLTRRLL